MHLVRRGKDISIGLDTEEEAIGLHAFLSGTVHTIPPNIAEKGQFIYQWFFRAIHKLASSYGTESVPKTQSGEDMQLPAVANTPTKKRNR